MFICMLVAGSLMGARQPIALQNQHERAGARGGKGLVSCVMVIAFVESLLSRTSNYNLKVYS